ncbi:MAG: poly-beta-hydroxybutyrate polymerase N-terminal domain-containing protein [Hyphomicrobiaceae bacterium]
MQGADAAWPWPDARRERDDDPLQCLAEALDHASSYALSRVTLGLSPAALAEAYFDWTVHLALAPGKQLQLTQEALRNTLRFWNYVATCALQERPGRVCIEPLPNDKRFSADAWHAWPFNTIHQAFLLQQQWWHSATTGVRGVTPQHERQVDFATRQLLDIFSPANFVLTNPEVLLRTQAEAGQNLVRGFWNLVEDWCPLRPWEDQGSLRSPMRPAPTFSSRSGRQQSGSAWEATRCWAGCSTPNSRSAARLMDSKAANRSGRDPNGSSLESVSLRILRSFAERASATADHASI